MLPSLSPTNQPKNAAQFVTTSSTGGRWIDWHATASVFLSNNTQRRKEAASKLALSDPASFLGFQIVAHNMSQWAVAGAKKNQHLTVVVVAPYLTFET